MSDAISFSTVNVFIGFLVSWMLAHWVLPLFFNTPRNVKRSFAITMIYTIAALVRNVLVYGVWVNV